MTRPALALLAVLLLSGCGLVGPKSPYVLAHEARERDAEFMWAYNACRADVAAFGLIPDLGITWERKFFRCMSQAGWEMPQDGRLLNRSPGALGSYYRRMP